jgi:hypothetical protein
MESLLAANNAIQNSGGRGNMAGVVAVSGNKPDGSTFMTKLVDFNTPVFEPCLGMACRTNIVLTTPSPITELASEIRNFTTTAAPVNVTTSATVTSTVHDRTTLGTETFSLTSPTTEVTVV